MVKKHGKKTKARRMTRKRSVCRMIGGEPTAEVRSINPSAAASALGTIKAKPWGDRSASPPITDEEWAKPYSPYYPQENRNAMSINTENPGTPAAFAYDKMSANPLSLSIKRSASAKPHIRSIKRSASAKSRRRSVKRSASAKSRRRSVKRSASAKPRNSRTIKIRSRSVKTSASAKPRTAAARWTAALKKQRSKRRRSRKGYNQKKYNPKIEERRKLNKKYWRDKGKSSAVARRRAKHQAYLENRYNQDVRNTLRTFRKGNKEYKPTKEDLQLAKKTAKMKGEERQNDYDTKVNLIFDKLNENQSAHPDKFKNGKLTRNAKWDTRKSVRKSMKMKKPGDWLGKIIR